MAHQKEKQKTVPLLLKFLRRRWAIAALLGVVCIIGLPLRAQNMKLNGYISDDAWWHYRQIKQVSESGRRLNPDIYEFTTLKRPMTYTPVFHYTVGLSHRLVSRWMSLVKFTNYFNILEAFLYILLIYGISYFISRDALFSVIGALGSAVCYGMIIRARAGELMPFVLGDLFALGSVLFLLKLIKDITQKDALWLSSLSGILMGLSLLSWSGGVFVYLPLILFVFLAIILAQPKFTKTALKLFSLCFAVTLFICLPWYLPLLLKYGLNPHSKEMDWFMKGFTVLHQVKPIGFYILTSGIPIFFIPIVFLSSLFRRQGPSIFFNLWIVLGVIATYTGWRGYVAVVPVISSIAISIGLSRIVYFYFKENSRYIPAVFLAVFLSVAGIGYHISALRLAPLDPKNINEVRTNEKSIKMLEFLKSNYPQAVTIDHITWMSEDEAVGNLRMTAGQYLEYLPVGSSEALKDTSRCYVADEEEAYQIFRKYNAELIIVRRQLLQLPQLSLLFAPAELKSEDFLKITKEREGSEEVTLTFTPRGMQSMLFRMLNRQKMEKFELAYADHDPDNPLPFVVVYKVKKD